jgi:hypothetical protein
MPTRTMSQSQNDPAVLFALAWAAAAAFAAQFAFGTHPSFFLPVGVCALPYAAGRNRAAVYRIGAAAALIAFISVIGLRQGSFFLPSLGGLAFSAYRALAGSRRGGRRRRR